MTTHSRRNFVKLAGAGAAMLSLGNALTHTGTINAQSEAPLPTPTAPTTATPSTQPAVPDAQMQAVLDELMALEAPPLIDMTPANARKTSPLTIAVQTVLTRQNKPPLELVGDIKHLQIPGGSRQPMLIRIYYPTGPDLVCPLLLPPCRRWQQPARLALARQCGGVAAGHRHHGPDRSVAR